MKNKKNDFILLSVISLMGLVLLAIFFLLPKGNYVTVTIDGQLYETYSLSEDRMVEIKGAHGGRNVLCIKDKKAWLEDCSCPDKTCEHMGKIDKPGQSVICLPNKVTVTVGGKDGEEVDAYQGGVYAK